MFMYMCVYIYIYIFVFDELMNLIRPRPVLLPLRVLPERDPTGN